ncbi:MAG TPA: aminopeptidase [Longimicrobiales bacterium]
MSRKLWIALVVVVLVAGATLTCSPTYVVRAGIEEARILSRREPITEVVADPDTSEPIRRKLEMVVEARTFAHRVLDLDVGDSYTTYSWVDRDTLALVLSAARQDRFEPVTWWFPIVGHIPYKGFFSLAEAREAARELEEEGYDTYIRPTGAFSTLGWFNDPLLSTILRYNDVSLVSTVIHELTHNTLFVPSRVSFNESFASFVGDRGAIAYFCALEGEDGERCREARADWSDNLIFGAFLQELIAELEAVYARTDLPLSERLARREEVFARAKARFVREVQPRLSVPGYRGFPRVPLNNARLIAWRIYYDRLHLFEAVYQRYAPDLPAAVRAIREAAAARPEDPFGAIARLASE